jgi:hypothetical protein
MSFEEWMYAVVGCAVLMVVVAAVVLDDSSEIRKAEIAATVSRCEAFGGEIVRCRRKLYCIVPGTTQ